MADQLVIWTIYDHPTDFPESYVARAHYIRRGYSEPSQEMFFAGTLDEVRTLLPVAADACLERSPEDDPVIVECWLELRLEGV